MKKISVYMVMVCVLGMGIACTDGNKGKVSVSNVDRKFAIEAAEANLMGIRTGELVKSNASSQEVKEYGTTVSDFYRIATKDLVTLAKQKDISLPTALGIPNVQDYNRLSALRGAEFDSAYINWAVRSNQQAIEALRKHTDATTDALFKNWVDARISTLGQIQQKATSIQKSLTGITTN